MYIRACQAHSHNLGQLVIAPFYMSVEQRFCSLRIKELLKDKKKLNSIN